MSLSARPERASMKFSSFRSRWHTWLPWQWLTASTSWYRMRWASGSSSFLCFFTSCCTVPPSTYSMMRWMEREVSITSYNLMMRLCRSFFRMRISCSTVFFRFSLVSLALSTVFMATSSPVTTERASETRPKAPLPSTFSCRYSRGSSAVPGVIVGAGRPSRA